MTDPVNMSILNETVFLSTRRQVFSKHASTWQKGKCTYWCVEQLSLFPQCYLAVSNTIPVFSHI